MTSDATLTDFFQFMWACNCVQAQSCILSLTLSKWSARQIREKKRVAQRGAAEDGIEQQTVKNSMPCLGA